MLNGMRNRTGWVSKCKWRLPFARVIESTPHTRTLADVQDGESAIIAGIICPRAARRERLLAYGLIDGQRITVVQKSPAFVVRVEETELAFDEQVARCIRVG